MNRRKMRMSKVLSCTAILAAGVIFSSCKKAPQAAPEKSSAPPRLDMPAQPKASGPKTDDAELERALDKRYGGDTAKKDAARAGMKVLDAQLDAEKELAEINRRTMVVPASADFKPKPVDRKVKLKLILEKTHIHPGDLVRFRLEMTNVGRQEIDFTEFRSGLFKYGGLLETDRIFFYFTPPGGHREKLEAASVREKMRNQKHRQTETHFEILADTIPANVKEDWLDNTIAKNAASTTFRVRLLPGETLRSRGDGDTLGETFRTLWCEQDFDKTGLYQLQVVLDDRPAPLTKTFIDASLSAGDSVEDIRRDHARLMKAALGPTSSNIVTVEVVK